MNLTYWKFFTKKKKYNGNTKLRRASALHEAQHKENQWPSPLSHGRNARLHLLGHSSEPFRLQFLFQQTLMCDSLCPKVCERS